MTKYTAICADVNTSKSIFSAFSPLAIECGYSPIPRRGKPGKGKHPNDAKRPAITEWSKFCDRQATAAEISKWNKSFPDAQLSLAMGYLDVFAIDIDEPEVLDAVRSVIGESFVAKIGQKGRTDFYRAAEALPESRKFYGHDKKPIVEILARGCQTVIPPSLHPVTGQPYRWTGEATIFDTLPDELPAITADQIAQLEVALEPWLLKKKQISDSADKIETKSTADLDEAKRKRYQAMADKVSETRIDGLGGMRGKGGRGRTLFEAACALGVFVHHGFIKQSELVSDLVAACKANGLFDENGEKDVRQTIAKGLKAAAGDKLPELKDRQLTRAKTATSKTVYGEVLVWPETNQQGEVVARSQANINAYLQHAGVTLAYNAFSCRNMITANGMSEPLEDQHIRTLWLDADQRGLKANQKYFFEVVFNICHLNKFNPVREFLDSLRWDGKPRLDSWLSTYLGAEQSEVISAQGAIHLIAAVRRVRNPGCKYDTMLVLEGKQGSGKSTAIRKLAGDDWFSDSLNVGDDAKIVLEQTADAWLVELAELAGIGKRDVESVKSFLSRQHDSARLSYDRCNTRRGRKFICFATTNSSDYLIDPTGNRRFWPVKVGKIDLSAIDRDRLQIWAEAAHREAKGESITLASNLWEAAATEQAARVQTDPWKETLESCIGDRCGKVSVSDIWQRLGIDSKSQNPALGKRVADIMRGLGFEKDRQRDASKGASPIHCYSKRCESGEMPWFCV